MLVAGAPTVEVARELGVDRRTVARCRSRAWSRHPDDEPFVRAEQAIARGRVAAVDAQQPPWYAAREPDVALVPLDELLDAFPP
jgi:hypothetical protein